MRTYRLSIKVNGKRVYTKLYRQWKDLRNRTQGRSTRSPHLYNGLEIGWASFAEYRAFALANGYRKGMSPDRIDPSRGYFEDNVRFITFSENWSKTTRWRGESDYAVRGEEPPPFYDD